MPSPPYVQELNEFTDRLFFGETSQDEIDWIETLLTIDSEQGRIVDFVLYPQQRMMAEGQTGRDLTVKGRQTRASSYIIARNLRRMVTHGGLKCLVMTQDDQVTATFRARIKHHLADLEVKGFPFKLGLDNDEELVIADTESRYMFGSGEERVAGRAYCVTPETPVLTGALRWLPAGQLEVGEEIIGFDEKARPGRFPRNYRKATITYTGRETLPVYELTLEDGTKLRASADHKWLAVKAGGRGPAEWVQTEEIALNQQVTWYLPRYLPTWETDQDREAGLLAGAFDADGSISSGSNHAPRIRFTQYPNELLEEVLSSLRHKKFEFRVTSNGRSPTSGKEWVGISLASWQESLRFIGQIRPARLLSRWYADFSIEERQFRSVVQVRVVEARYLGEIECAALSSSTDTYLTSGFASRNTGHIVHLSEFAHYPPERTGILLGGIQPSVPGPPYGWIDIESTPNGAEGKFYELVMGSKTYDPLSRWTTHFYSWWLEPRYRAGSVEGCDILYPENEWERIMREFKPTTDEEQLMEEHGLDVGQVVWRRVRKKEQDATDAPFLQEYPETLEGCFLTAGGSYFASPDGINHLERYRHTVSPPKEVLDSVPFRGGTVHFNGPNLYVWQTPQASRPYVVWVDCAGGGLSEDADFSAIVVLDAAEKFVAARLAVKVAPQELAPMAVAIATWYNNALLGGERDAFGSVCLNRIQQINYRNLWYYVEPGSQLKIHQAPQDPWGHPTAIRNHILSSLRESVFSGTFHTADSWLVQQMGAFTWRKVAGREKMKASGKKGYKDDLVMCVAGCVFIAPLGAARYQAQWKGASPTEPQPIRENEVVLVGRHGLVLNRYPGKRGALRPWLR